MLHKAWSGFDTPTMPQFQQSVNEMKLTEFAVGGKEGFLAAYFATHLAKRIGLAYGRAVEAWSEYGNGFIYTPSGMVMEDSDHNRNRAVKVWGACIIVTQEGRMMIWTKGVARKISAKKRKGRAYSQRSNEIATAKREREQYRAKREREEMFEACKGERCPKRQGQARGMEYAGKYISRYYPTIEQIPEPLSASIFNRNYIAF